ncbi:MAG TPA: TonB-dependent receptor [Terracidiphilus sp.]
MLRKNFVYLLFACLCTMFPLGARAQTVNGVITGTITDPSGAVVPNAKVTITNTGTGLTQNTTTGAGGDYRFQLVPPGVYTVQLEASGFGTEKANNVVVQASQTVPFSVKLKVASQSQLIEVTGQAPLVQTESSDLNMQVDNTTIQNMALVDRDVFSELPFLAPQAMPGLDTTITAGGARESGTSYMLNGAEDNDNFGEGSANIHPPLESVQDFSVLTNNMSAEFGRGMGALITANQKAGSNKFHGVVYEFNRNASLNANDYFYNQNYSSDPTTFPKKPKYIRNQFGGEVDGPIYKDRTFFAGAYDRTKLLSGYTAAHTFVPTTAAIAFLQANGGPLAQEVLGARPPVTSDNACPGLDGTGVGTDASGLPFTVGCLSFFDPQNDTIDAYFGRVDQNFGHADRLSFIANIYREFYNDQFGGGPLTTKGAIANNTTNHFHNLTLVETHTFGTRVVNEATLGHNRHYNVAVEGSGVKDTLPNIYVDEQNEGYLSYQIGGNYEGGNLSNFTQDRWSFQDNLSVLMGKHSFKFGGGTQYGILYRDWDLGSPGQYEFGELISVNGTCPACSVITPATDPNGSTLQPDGSIANLQDETLTSFAGDYPYFSETSIDPRTGGTANAYRHYMNHDYYVFVQDDWKATPRLTLNLGLRWDRYGAPTEAHNIISQLINFNSCNYLEASCLATLRVGPVSSMWPTKNHDFGPRIGFAFDPSGNHKMAIRGGWGVMYDRIFDNIWSNGAWNPPFYALADFQGDAGDAIYYSNPASIGPTYNPNGPCGQIPNAATDTCTGHRAALRTMDRNMHDSSGQSFYLSVEREVPGNLLGRIQYQAELGRHLPMLQNLNRVDGDAANSRLSPVPPNPLYNGFNYRSNSVSSNYHSLILQAQKRMSNGLQFDTSYTYSKLLDVNSELFAGCSTIGGQSAPYYYITNKNTKTEYGRGSFDHRGAFKLNAVYELPFFKAEKGIVGHALGGWHMGGFYQFYTGHPVEVWDGRSRKAARDANGAKVLDRNGIPYNIGGDYNLDGTANDRPDFIGTNLKSVYTHGDPAKGIFKDGSPIGSCASWVPSNVANCSSGNSLFETPPYPSSGPTYERFGTLGRDVFTGPSFAQIDLSVGKSFKLTERTVLDFRGQAQNLANHPNFDAVTGNLSSSKFGQAQQLVPFGLGEPKSRVMSLGARLAF